MAEAEGTDSLDGIAIVGIAGRFPGAADFRQFWENLRNGVESISFFSREELLAAGVPRSIVDNPDYVPAKGVLEDADCFDAEFFGFIPTEAEMTDPQQRVFLECAWTALEDAGYDPQRCEAMVGVFGGMSRNGFLSLVEKLDHNEQKYGGYALRLGTDKDYLTTRVSYKLNLHGPSLDLQTACSTSLVAICQAAQSLLNYQCDLALAGGVGISIPLKCGQLHQQGAIHSPDGHCRAFDALAEGTVAGDGAGIVVLKRLSEAVADRDNIYAVIRGFAVNNDGSDKVGFTAPSPEGQSQAINAALSLAGVSPDTISYVEAHGTGTSLGDPIEIAGLTKAFRALGSERNGYCAIGSVKTNIGHLDAAAGVAGLIKTVLAMRHRMLPPSLHFTSPNPKFDLASTPFFVNSRLRDWTCESGPRRAGVSSFGLGGTNAHVILEEAPFHQIDDGKSRPYHLLTLSAKTPQALESVRVNLAAHLKSHSDANIADTAFTLQLGRSAFGYRSAIVCQDVIDAIQLLEKPDARKGIAVQQVRSNAPIIFMFPGQGAQQANMARELYEGETIFREQVDLCAQILLPILGLDLRTVLYPKDGQIEEAQKKLTQTSLTQPALFVVEYALARLWMSWGIVPAAMLGHSVGEYVAACIAEVLSLPDALFLLASRARLMQSLPVGSMLAVRSSHTEVMAMMSEKLSLAAVNSPGLCTISGPGDEVQQFEQKLQSLGVSCKKVATSHAFHSAMMSPIEEPFISILKGMKIHAPRIPYMSNLTGTWITEAQVRDPNYWFRHLRETVRFSDCLAELARDPQRILLEVGPGQTLTMFARQHPDRQSAQAVLSSIATDETQKSELSTCLGTLGRMWMAGVEVKWSALHSGEHRRRVSLPTYPFERKKFWPSGSGNVESTSQSDLISQSDSNGVMHGKSTPVTRPSTISVEKKMTEAVQPRKERILASLKDTFHELSGIDVSRFDPHVSFLELGFDSLFLTRAQVELRRKFEVRITFRQLFEDAPTMDLLAEYIDRTLSPEKFPEPSHPLPEIQPTDLIESLADSLSLPALGVDPGSSNLLERVIAQQLQLMAAQLDAVRRGQADVKPSDAHGVSSAIPSIEQKSRPDSSRQGASTPKVHGPFKPFDKTVQSGLNALQQKHLDKLIERYCRKTAGSKRLTAEQRPHLSDPRAVTGFRQAWKEMVYQIAVTHSAGSRMWDVDGNEYIDVTMGFGVNLFGFSPPFIMSALEEQLRKGIELGVLCPLNRSVADAICEFTGMDRASFVNTGSEANMAAVRAARTVTGRDKIAVFVGAYHGIFDEVLVNPLRVNGGYRPVPVAPGILQSMVENVVVLDYDDPDSITRLRAMGHELAAVFVEPIQSRHPDLQPREFLHALRAVTQETGAALIFDEVITGFRLHPRGAQGWFGVQADIASYGKLIGGGIAMAVVAGKAAYMDAFDGGQWNYGDDSFPEAGVTFFGGTFVKHPLALAASAAALEYLKKQGPDLYKTLNERSDMLAATVNQYFVENCYPLHVEHCGSMFQLALPPNDEPSRLIYYFMRDKGIHIYDRPFFLSTAHSDDDIDQIIRVFKESADEMRACGLIGTLPDGGGPGGVAPAALTLTDPAEVVSASVSGNLSESRVLPLSQEQKEIWLAAQLGPDASAAFNLSLSVDLRGSLDVDALRRAVDQVVARHEALRIVLSPDGDVQQFASSLHIDVPVVDLCHVAEGKQEDQFSEFIGRDTRQPFNLINGPLLRSSLVKFSDGHHRLVLTWFHIVSDGWSVAMIVKDLSGYYTANVQNVQPQLPEPMQFGDYLAWRAAPEQRKEATAAEKFWLSKFDDRVPDLDLPTDRARPHVKTYDAGETSITLDSKLVSDLTRLSAQYGCTKFAAMFAAFGVLLHRLSGQEDIVIGLAAAGQAAVGNDYLVGHCVSLLPYRSRVAGDMLFSKYLGATRSALMDAYDNQLCTYGSLISKLNLPRDPSRLPLMSVIITHETDTAGVSFAGLQSRMYANPKPSCNFDLEFYLTESETEVTAKLSFNTDLYQPETIQRWLRHYETLLSGITRQPEQRIDELPLLTTGERRQVITDWNETGQNYENEACIHELIEAQARRVPDKTAVVFGSSSLTYRELNNRAEQLARHLRANGVQPDSLVGICVERSLEMVVSILSVLKAGGAYVPIDPVYPKDRIAFILDDTRATLLVTQRSLAPDLPSTVPRLIFIDEPLPATDASPKTWTAPSSGNLAYILFTSGSTGRPKGVQITHRCVVNFLESMRHSPGMKPDDTLLAVTTLSFDIAGLELLLPLVTGANVVIASQDVVADAARLAQLVRDSSATVMQATPATWQILIEGGWKGDRRLKILCGGDALNRDLAMNLLQRCGELWNMYGPTETTIWSSHIQIKEANVPITIGRPIANTQFYVVDPRMNPVPIGVPGELLIGGDGVARGYLNRDSLTAERFISNPFQSTSSRLYRTGDLARWLPDGNIECLGRIDNQVKIRGHRIELGEIESILVQLSPVTEAVVVARNASTGSPRLVAYFVCQSESAPSNAVLREHLRKQLPDYMIPHKFVRLAKIPLTANGKVDRKALQAADMHAEKNRMAARTNVEAPGDVIHWSSVESELAKRLSIPSLKQFGDFESRLNLLCGAYLSRYLTKHGVKFRKGERITGAALKEKLQVSPDFEKFIDYMLTVLSEDRVIEQSGDEVIFLCDGDNLRDPDGLHRDLLKSHPQFSGLLQILQRCGTHLMEALSESIPAITVLFPDGKREYLDRLLFQETIECSNLRVYQELAREFLLAQAKARPVRILEIGGGEGLLTWRVIPDLKGLSAEYVFTDIGMTFVAQAKKKAEALGVDFMRFQKFDISRPGREQGFEEQSFDVIFGLNVMHAIPNIGTSLVELKRLLKPDGKVCLVELVKAPRWENLIWGFAKGWWYFQDEWRTSVPLVSLDVWEDVFRQAEFSVWALPANSVERQTTEAGFIVGSVSAEIESVDRPAFQAPGTRIEAQLANIWRQILDVEQVGINDNFFELGGDSILAIRAISKARQEGLEFTLRSLFSHQTIAELASIVTVASVQPSAEQAPVQGDAPFRISQEELNDLLSEINES